MAAEAVSRRLAEAVRDLSGAWYGRHMAAAERAIRTRLPLVDLVLEVRDARAPASSAFEPLHRRTPLDPDGRRVVVLNKADLADPSETERWMAYMKKERSCPWVAVNSHNRESIKELLNVVRSRIREIKHGKNDCTGTVLLVGIPNVGKSAIVNAMHQIGRIGAAEKGKLKHAIVSSHPGETRDIIGYKVASHPNIYVLDTPGVLSPRFVNEDSGPRLALIGAIKDSLLEEYDIAQFLLAIVNSREEYRKWEDLNQVGDNFSRGNSITSRSHNNKRQYASDHTQDFIVRTVRQVLSEAISSFKGDLGEVDEFKRLISYQLVSLQEAFKVSTEPREELLQSHHCPLHRHFHRMDQRIGEDVALKHNNIIPLLEVKMNENTEAERERRPTSGGIADSVPALSLTSVTASPVSSNVKVGKIMDIPHPQGTVGVQPSNRKQKTTHTTNAPEVETVQLKQKRTRPASALEAETEQSKGKRIPQTISTPEAVGTVQPKRKRTPRAANAPEAETEQPKGKRIPQTINTPEAVGTVQPKRKRTPRPASAPEGEIEQPKGKRILHTISGGNQNSTLNPSNALEVGEEWNQSSPELEHHPNVVEVLGHDGEEEDIGHDWEGEDIDNDWEEEDAEGQTEQEMVENFVHGEENRKFRSKVWDEFSKIRMNGVVTKGQCMHCNARITAKRGVGTSAMSTHLKRCKVRKNVTNVARQLKSVVMSPEGVALEKWRFSQDVSRNELVRMISLHGFPLAMVDYDGFRRFVSSLNPVFKMISRRTISTDCLKKFEGHKRTLRNFFSSTKSRISLTMDMWTSNQTLGYMCITSHFIDDDWVMHKRIIKFSFLKTPHTGIGMFNAVLKSIQEWGIEHKLFAITLDNAGNNNAMTKLLRGNLLEKKLLGGEGMLFHCRCAGHILNLACKAGFAVINPIVHKVRESVKFLEGSPSRKQKFEEIIQQLGITYKKRPNIDTCTRWNSTYIMLETCLHLKRAFESLDHQEQNYTFAPSPDEWEKAQKVCGLLKSFYDATMVISGSLYPTSNLYFHEIWEVKIALENGILEQDAELIDTIKFMQAKFKKYWKLSWLQVSFPVIFDPRFKLAFIDFRLRQAFGNRANSKIDIVKKVLLRLFKDYSDSYQETRQISDVGHASGRYADWDTHMKSSACSTNDVPSELESYLTKPPIPRSESFDILAWWKSNASEYPTVSRMARDILAVQASTVASESAFSMGRRILSDFRSRLTSKTVEALVCLQDWIRASGTSQFSMEGIDCSNLQLAESMEQMT